MIRAKMRALALGALLLAIPFSKSAAEEAYLADNVYLNDMYGFVLPLPKTLTACVAPPFASEHGVVVRLRGHACEPARPLLGIGGYWSNSDNPKSPSAAQQFCGAGGALPTDIRFGPLPVYRCVRATQKERTYYTIGEVTIRSKAVAVGYVMSLRDMPCSEQECEAIIRKIVSEARFLSAPTPPQ